MGLKRPDVEADRSSSSRVEIMKGWSHIYALLSSPWVVFNKTRQIILWLGFIGSLESAYTG